MIICVTGHRPNKLYGYDLSDERWLLLKEKLKVILIENNCNEAVTGMALGVDTIFALAVLELKDAGYDIKLHCAIPCKNHSCKWPKSSQDLYKQILKRADKIVYVSNSSYTPDCMQKRNEYMVDIVDKVIAVWNGSSGGTANCVYYAREQKKEIIKISI